MNVSFQSPRGVNSGFVKSTVRFEGQVPVIVASAAAVAVSRKQAQNQRCLEALNATHGEPPVQGWDVYGNLLKLDQDARQEVHLRDMAKFNAEKAAWDQKKRDARKLGWVSYLIQQVRLAWNKPVAPQPPKFVAFANTMLEKAMPAVAPDTLNYFIDRFEGAGLVKRSGETTLTVLNSSYRKPPSKPSCCNGAHRH